MFRLSPPCRWLLLLCASWFFCGHAFAEEAREFTPWMTNSELNAFFEGLDGDKPEGKNYWDRGNRINAVEGRWEAGVPQYRISYGPVPPNRAQWWSWYLNVDQNSFDQLVHKSADDGSTLVQWQSFTRPGGSVRYQAVWQKLVPMTGAPALPEGRYRLTEVEGAALDSPDFTIRIEGTKLSGQTPSFAFTGSVRDRFSGSLTKELLAKRSGVPAFGSPDERNILKLLENAHWVETDGKLRVLQTGKTALRFAPLE